MNKKVNFGTSVSVESGGMGEEPKELTLEEKVDNIGINTANMFNEHGTALNSIAYWIAKNDKKVAQCGTVVDWAMKEMAKEQRLAERKAAYKAGKK